MCISTPKIVHRVSNPVERESTNSYLSDLVRHNLGSRLDDGHDVTDDLRQDVASGTHTIVEVVEIDKSELC